MGNLSILVVSKTAQFLSQLLDTIPNALRGYQGDVEVLCSWNGSAEEEKKVCVPNGVELYFSQRVPYHFASNCNQLAQRACGELLLFINDDLTLDAGSITSAIETLATEDQCGLVGAKLRCQNGSNGHFGILFDHTHKPFHRYLHCPSDHPLTERTERVPASTAAFLLTRASDYARCPMNEAYINNGEDVELCLAYKMNLGLYTVVCHRTTGHHPERSTRGQQHGDAGFGNDNSEDLARMRKFRQQVFMTLSREDLAQELDLANRESHWCHQRISNLEEAQNHQALLRESEVVEAATKAELVASAEKRKQFSVEALDQARRAADLEIAAASKLAEQAQQRSMAWKQTFRSNRGG